jgi:monovalent cation:H+ antiporter-2, CPA2 family
MVLVLVLLPALAAALGGHAPEAPAGGGKSLFITVALTLAKVAAFVCLMLLAGKRLFPWILKQIEKTGSRELFTLAVMALALGVAFGSAELFGVSFALGSFFAGLVVNESDSSHRAARDLQPLQDAFSVLFFIAVGMLFDPMILVRHPFQVLLTAGLIIVGKSAIAFGIAVALGCDRATALMVSAGLSQIGEFSFSLAALGIELGLLPADAQHLLVAGALLSITCNPFIFRIAARGQSGLKPETPGAAARGSAH